MPALPTVAAIAGIISCFQSAASLFTAVNSRKEATKRHEEVQAQRAEDRAAERASKALTLGRFDIQHEYDRGFARLGPRFATGDEAGCMQLMSELVQMQQQVIHVLHSALMGGHLDTSRLAVATNTRTDNTISVLHNQYQRMAIAAPIQRSFKPRSLPLKRPRLCPEAERLLLSPSASPRYKSSPLIPDPRNPTRFGRECLSCSSTWEARPLGLIKDPVTKLRYPSDFQFRCHTPVNELYLCYICGPEHESPVLDGHAELMAHLRTHSQNDLLRPARTSPPVSVRGNDYERSWMPAAWNGGYVEDMSFPSPVSSAGSSG